MEKTAVPIIACYVESLPRLLNWESVRRMAASRMTGQVIQVVSSLPKSAKASQIVQVEVSKAQTIQWQSRRANNFSHLWAQNGESQNLIRCMVFMARCCLYSGMELIFGIKRLRLSMAL
jgi:hypothetical protein